MERRTPLTRAGKPRPRSVKRQADMVVRRALVQRLLAERPRCEALVKCHGARSVDVHERLTRARGGSITDPDQAHMITVCRRCHSWITENPAAATFRRLMLPSWHRCAPGGVGPC